ncbi:MAG: type III-B CRISPR module RAMP protein Cmr4 [Desulfitobacteriaceae bacterium]|nr:type III-B CRISPR module RAMP protein Cmr4 [Desulfitobacteriaceae bacterium]MDI6915130.1 type III-B CRISPR module RAMP protein Cmr4 [Desulfitobacteriaceae bacterium]
MKSALLGLLAETSVHPGAGQNMGTVDLPVARETAQSYPVIVGSSMKGALRDKARDRKQETRLTESESTRRLFGDPEAAAARISISDARLLLLPIRSLTSHYYWVTCPYIIERLERDCERVGLELQFPPMKSKEISEGTARIAVVPENEQQILFLEELTFGVEGEPDVAKLAGNIQFLIRPESVKQRLTERLAVISDDDFAYFAKNGLTIQARNVLDDGKRSQNLWYEESLPPDTLFYSLILGQEAEDLAEIQRMFEQSPYLQVGGNETIGQGWMNVAWLAGGR